MRTPFVVECDVTFCRRARGRKALTERATSADTPGPIGRVPRVARLMALALRFERLIRTGVVADYTTLAALGRVTCARVSQIMNLVQLAPDIQEAILFLPRVERGQDPIILRQSQPIAAALDWRHQRLLWRRLCDRAGVPFISSRSNSSVE
jgi:hypothetical protein